MFRLEVSASARLPESAGAASGAATQAAALGARRPPAAGRSALAPRTEPSRHLRSCKVRCNADWQVLGHRLVWMKTLESRILIATEGK